jgi:hypothetical protein
MTALFASLTPVMTHFYREVQIAEGLFVRQMLLF